MGIMRGNSEEERLDDQSSTIKNTHLDLAVTTLIARLVVTSTWRRPVHPCHRSTVRAISHAEARIFPKLQKLDKQMIQITANARKQLGRSTRKPFNYSTDEAGCVTN
jgi:hypothetical protein